MAIEHHIRNPVEWGWDQFRSGSHALGAAALAIYGDVPRDAGGAPAVRAITANDIRYALRRGFDDFAACRSDVIFLCVIFPVLGLVLARFAVGQDMVPLIFPLASGFALLGPVAAMGLYEMSRRREQGQDVGWADAFGVVRSPAFGAILTLSLILFGLFLAWLAAAWAIYAVTLGPAPPTSIAAFLGKVFTTPAGWAMIAAGIGVGFVFALLVLVVSVVSFPLLLDRNVGLARAVSTSVRAVASNPGPMLLWGFIVAAGLVLGSIPALLGLAVVLPVLGHATWHLYRCVVTPRAGT